MRSGAGQGRRDAGAGGLVIDLRARRALQCVHPAYEGMTLVQVMYRARGLGPVRRAKFGA
jgi:hypothetical protein